MTSSYLVWNFWHKTSVKYPYCLCHSFFPGWKTTSIAHLWSVRNGMYCNIYFPSNYITRMWICDMSNMFKILDWRSVETPPCKHIHTCIRTETHTRRYDADYFSHYLNMLTSNIPMLTNTTRASDNNSSRMHIYRNKAVCQIDNGAGGTMVAPAVKVTTHLCFFQIWNDPRLSWNPVDYEGVQYVSLSAKDIWVPNIGLVNR